MRKLAENYDNFYHTSNQLHLNFKGGMAEKYTQCLYEEISIALFNKKIYNFNQIFDIPKLKDMPEYIQFLEFSITENRMGLTSGTTILFITAFFMFGIHRS